MYAYLDIECIKYSFCHFRPLPALLAHYWPQKSKFGNVKNSRRYYPFTHVHHKSRSYDVWFLRYKVQRTKFFVILGHFLPFDPPNPNNCQILSFYTCVPQTTITWCMVPEISSTTDNFLSFWAIFCPFTPVIIQKIKILKKIKKCLEILSLYT